MMFLFPHQVMQHHLSRLLLFPTENKRNILTYDCFFMPRVSHIHICFLKLSIRSAQRENRKDKCLTHTVVREIDHIYHNRSRGMICVPAFHLMPVVFSHAIKSDAKRRRKIHFLKVIIHEQLHERRRMKNWWLKRVRQVWEEKRVQWISWEGNFLLLPSGRFSLKTRAHFILFPFFCCGTRTVSPRHVLSFDPTDGFWRFLLKIPHTLCKHKHILEKLRSDARDRHVDRWDRYICTKDIWEEKEWKTGSREAASTGNRKEKVGHRRMTPCSTTSLIQ